MREVIPCPKVDVELNRVCRTITDNLKATPLPVLYTLAGICPPGIRRDVQTRIERDKQLSEPRHPLFGGPRRLGSRHSFMAVQGLEGRTSETLRVELWKGCNPNDNRALPAPSETLPPGTDMRGRNWAALTRARAKLARWGRTASTACSCGEDPKPYST